MAKKKKKRDSMTGVAVGGIMATTMVGSMPNPTGSSAISGIKTGAATGFSKVGTALPIMGKVKGTRMVLGAFSKLGKEKKKLLKKLKGGRR